MNTTIEPKVLAASAIAAAAVAFGESQMQAMCQAMDIAQRTLNDAIIAEGGTPPEGVDALLILRDHLDGL